MDLKKKDAAALIGKKPQTVGAYCKGIASPTLDDLPQVAKVLGVTSDWLLGGHPSRKWGAAVSDVRLYLRGQLHRVRYSTVANHVAIIIGIMQERSELCRQPWFLAGVLGISIADYQQVLLGEGDLNDEHVERFAEFTGLPKIWLTLLKDQDLPQAPDIEEYYPFVAQLHAWGISGEEAARHAPTLREVIFRNRRHPEF